jgi:NAD(P)-dependent dehydrogenase (short-subunit alcohol dehydrogenase family)
MEGRKSMNVIITGTSSGVGKACALKFLKEGFTVYGLDIQAPTIEQEGFHSYTCDVSKYEQLPDLVNAEYVVNNAGTVDEKRAIDVNLVGYINVAKKYCDQSAIKAVTNIGSISGRAGIEDINYCASQGGRIAMTKNLAIRLGNKYRCRVNCISLGAVMTGFEPQIYADQKLVDAVAEENLLKRWSDAQEIAEWIYFVTVINRSMTGQEILLDNGEEANYHFIQAEK